MPIHPELRSLYPPHWRELSARVRFEWGRRPLPALRPAAVASDRHPKRGC